MQTKNTDTALFLTIPQAAALLGCWPERLRRAVDAGQVPTIVLSKQRLVPRRAIERLALIDDGPGQRAGNE